MRKSRHLALVLLLSFVLGLLPACGANKKSEAIDDKYRNFYEVFVYSFKDSNGDGIGDLKGLEEKLDYIADMGFTGLWLMPIMPSPSYHKYDVTNYYDIDPQYGTLADFKSMLTKAHELGIHVIIDLVLNHSSSQHPWFLEAQKDENSPYRDYYVWSKTFEQGYTQLGDWYYESRFVDTMPDLNLDNPNLREEIVKIMSFWLKDIGVDGFRLDAVTSYYTGNRSKNVEFLSWLGDEARKLSKDCYLVAEAWTDLTDISAYAEAKIDSFFLFPAAQHDGYIAKTLADGNKTPGRTYASAVETLEQSLPASSIPAPFSGNHDTGRPAGYLGRKNTAKQKMAGGLLAMMRGCPFVYYGEEIGMSGSKTDPDKRLGMIWTSYEETTKLPPGAEDTPKKFIPPSVEEQKADPNSLLNYYKAAMHLRSRFPEIARGTSEILDGGSEAACLIRRTWEERSVILAINPSLEPVTLSLPGDQAQKLKLEASLLAEGGEAVLADGQISLPPYAIAILR